ncbi:nitrogen fixation protein NifX [Roseospira navarrensis]|uniref:Nitrogen fixation protein NifX n=1 Tax=Roseospira navarrensis TaxID=140058 RepID=A0A7X1ZG67_9PROT|nr:nitrogen fixation protein NifX [Roseospira navarrensis]MQX37978.1 nitrogen fixation protein NifX [Roseospira navarrensis]
MTAMRRLRLVDGEGGPAAAPSTAGPSSSSQEMPSVKVALATQDMTAVNAHFAGARTLAIFDVSADGWSLVEAVQFEDATAQDGNGHATGEPHEDDRVGSRLAAMEGCTLLFVKAIGGPAAARVVNARIHPVKVQTDEPVETVLERVRTMLNGTPPPWLRKAMTARAAGDAPRTDFMDDDDDA